MKKKKPTRASRRLWSWAPDKRASRACIAHHVAEAIRQKEWAALIDAEWCRNACDMSLAGFLEDTLSSVYTLARRGLEYHRYRAFMPGAYSGYPGDRPAHDLWRKLNP